MKLVHWPLMGGLLHLVQQGGDKVGLRPSISPAINHYNYSVPCSHHIAV